MYDLIIIGGGPGGAAAGIYAARKKIKSLVIAGSEGFGGQSLVSSEIQNWIGTKSVSGFELGKMLEEHLRAQEGIEVLEDLTKKIEKIGGGFKVVVKTGKVFETKTVLVASGSRRQKLNVLGEKEFDGKGVSYCSTCDAPLFKNRTVAVIGGGNSGLEAVVDLMSYAKKIYLLEHNDKLKGDPVTQEKIKNSGEVEIILKANTIEILGNKMVTGLKYEDLNSGETKELKLEGIFVEIGSTPNTEFVEDLVKTNQYGEIIINHQTQQTSQEGIWASGDVSDVLYKQNNISAGDAIKAVLNIYDYLNKNA